MSWVKNLMFWKRAKIKEELDVEEQFRAQLREAFLCQDDLLAAVQNMKRAREKYRSTLRSSPSR